MLKKIRNIIILSFLLFSLVTISSANSAEWIGFVIKVMDNAIHKGDDRIPYMIFPQSRTYSSRSICYSEFQDYFANDTRYPQTSDPYESYLYGCIKDRKRKAYIRGNSVKETVKNGFNKGVEVGKEILDETGVSSFIKGLLD